jgi:hypothetical protein
MKRRWTGAVLPRGYKLTKEIDKTRSNSRPANNHPENLDLHRRPSAMQEANRKSRAKVTLPKVNLE